MLKLGKGIGLSMRKNHVIILASGNGERLGHTTPKQFIKVAGKSIIEHTLDVFNESKNIDDIIVVINPKYRTLMESIILKGNYSKITKILNGGKTRSESSYIGLSCIEDEDDIVLIHDAVRPFVSEDIINKCINAMKYYNAVDVAISSADTIIQINGENLIENIPDRRFLKRGQTPQAFKVGLIKKAHELAKNDQFGNVTDDCGLILKYKLSDVYVIDGEEKNIKITYKEDLYMADKLFQLNSREIYKKEKSQTLNDKVVVVFGGTEGIGKAIADLSLKYKSKVYSFSRTNGVDVSVPDLVKGAVKSVFDQEGRIDFVVNTAGLLRMGKLETRDILDIENEIKVNYLGSINVVKESIPYLKKSKGSILLFTSSSYTRGRALYSVYSSTKAAIVNLVQAIAEELHESSIRINAINPERTNTPMRRKNFGFEPENTLLNPNKVAEVSIQTLLSNLSGQVIDVRNK